MKIKTVFITASSSGIGFYLAKRYLDNNYKVIINGRNKKKLINASNNLNGCDFILSDMTSIKNIKSTITKIKKKYKSIDLLIANLGNGDYKKNNKNFSNALNYNLLSTINLVENSKKILKSKSKIICVSSICGVEIIKGAPIGYSVSKAALNFYVKSISRELVKFGISINAVLPGNIMFENSTWDKKMKLNKINTKKYIKENVPTNSFGSTDDIFEICHMISESSGFINGSLIRVDGGQTQSI
tara:strand:- start:3283 stop:4011 length:729 start_codon:yes stop_codon:yes gene_type:complete